MVLIRGDGLSVFIVFLAPAAYVPVHSHSWKILTNVRDINRFRVPELFSQPVLKGGSAAPLNGENQTWPKAGPKPQTIVHHGPYCRRYARPLTENQAQGNSYLLPPIH